MLTNLTTLTITQCREQIVMKLLKSGGNFKSHQHREHQIHNLTHILKKNLIRKFAKVIL